MLVRMQADASPADIEGVQAVLDPDTQRAQVIDNTIVVSTAKNNDPGRFGSLPGVARVEKIDTPYKLVHRSLRPEGTRVRVGDIEIGGSEFVVAAGPCAVESEAQVMATAGAVATAGARILRGGAFKPRTSPYSFRGLEKKGLELLARAGRALGLAVVTEVLNTEDVPLVAEHADVLQIGARNMQNFSLLEAAGKAAKPVLLKRGLSATVEEWLLAAEYIALQGNLNIILCERGIRTFETATRNTLDLGSAVLLKERTHLPVFVDPSHATGHRNLVEPLSKAAAAAGVAGLIVEVHPEPESALCDGAQSLTLDDFERMMESLALVLASQKRSVGARWNRTRNLDRVILRLIGQRAGVADLPDETVEEVFRDIIRRTREEGRQTLAKAAAAHANI